MTLDIRNIVANIYTEIVTQRNILRGLSPYTQAPALIEDALGWTFQIPLDVVSSWEVSRSCTFPSTFTADLKQTVDSILYDRFLNRPGREMVRKRRYIMQDDLSGKDFRQDIPFNAAIRPGQKVNMSFVYYSKEESRNSCPRCKMVTVSGNDVDVLW